MAPPATEPTEASKPETESDESDNSVQKKSVQFDYDVVPDEGETMMDGATPSIQKEENDGPSKNKKYENTINPCWSNLTEGIFHTAIRKCVTKMGVLAARNPMPVIHATSLISVALVLIGYFTNFELELDQNEFLTPTGSYPDVHAEWIRSEESGFPLVRPFYFVFHHDGANMLYLETMRVALEGMALMTSTPGFDDLCAQSQYLNTNREPACFISSVTTFWDHNLTLMEEQLQAWEEATTENNLQNDPEEYIYSVVSQTVYPDGTPVYHEAILGYYEGYNTSTMEPMDLTDAAPLSLENMINVMEQDSANNDDSFNARKLQQERDLLTITIIDFEDNGDSTLQQEEEEGLDSNNANDGDEQVDEEVTNDPSTSTGSGRMRITAAQSYVMRVDIPDIGKATDDLETALLDRLADFQDLVNEDRYQENQDQQPSDSESVNTKLLKFEYFTLNGYQTEMMRALLIDLPLVAVLIFVMVAFTTFVFYKWDDPVQSRGLVGIHAMSVIGLSMLTGYGTMWCIGVPMTTVAIMIPFVVVGVGLDDTFIITGTYFRLSREQQEKEAEAGQLVEEKTFEQKTEEVIQRIHTTLDEVSVSITMTTVTTLTAFLLGSSSDIPAVRWLCLYAAMSLFAVYIYQITTFVAFLALDEQRVHANRRDLCFWIIVSQDDADSDETDENAKQIETPPSDGEATSSDPPSPVAQQPKPGFETLDTATDDVLVAELESNDITREWKEGSPTAGSDSSVKQTEVTQPLSSKMAPHKNKAERPFSERMMGWYADQLLKPFSKALVLLFFAAYFAGTVYSTSLLHQEFNIKDYIPEDSFMTSFMTAFDDYGTVFRYIGVYFRYETSSCIVWCGKLVVCCLIYSCHFCRLEMSTNPILKSN